MSDGRSQKPRPPSQPIDGNYTVLANGCWQWTGRADKNGYGKAYDPLMPAGHRVDWAHRIAYRKFKGAIPPGLELDHTCENTLCVNPDHLDPLTRAEHVRRTVQRLGYDEVQRKAAYLRMRGYTLAEIADAFGWLGKETAARHIDSAIQKGLVSADAIPRVSHLTDEDHQDMRDLYTLGVSQGEIAAFYGVNSSRVSRVVNGKTSRDSTCRCRSPR